MTDDDTPDKGGDIPSSSPLAGLREQVDAARAQAVIDLVISDLDWTVRYQALDFDTMDRVQRNLEKGKRDPLRTFGPILTDACVGIFTSDDDGRLVGPDGDSHIDDEGKIVGAPLTFSSEALADALQVNHEAVQVIRALFPRRLEISRHAMELQRFSGGEDTQAAQQRALGN